MFPFLKLTDGTITLRPFEFGEEKELHGAIHESLPELTPWMSWASEKYSIETARNFIAITRGQWSSGMLYAFAIADAVTGELVGGCSLSHIHPVYYFCNLGYWVRSSRHGEGIAGAAAKLAARFGFERAGLIRAEIVVAVGNDSSKRVAEKIGAHYEGILLNRMVVGQSIHDAHMFSLLPSDFGLDAHL
ncbi:MAG: GNAT family N-acetyltransferase [Anaerolineales bacterium]|uniref:GNAT family N-acetyltransferase n=1 Tax=Candidatus Villigracilis affinis TaxID=3140682 RepID=UPI002A1B2CD2|nr:GNAT family N-acetyltransferase [Anaerolineales bacterium]MBL0348569.1 GNAT family N-acetyltransferase [Anaerolineales bacterium]